MTSAHGGAHPSPEEVDALLDRTPTGQGVYDVDFEERVAAHVADCEECTRLLEGMRQVRGLLRAEGSRTPPMPDGLTDRLDAALARASAARAGTVLPMDAGRSGRLGGRSSTGRSGSRRSGTRRTGAGTTAPDTAASPAPSRVPRWLTVAAGLAVIGGAAAASTQLLDRSGSDSTSAGALAGDRASGEEAAPQPVGDVVSTGTDYESDTLAAQVTTLLDEPRDVLGGVTAGGAPQREDDAGADGSSATRLADPAALGQCLTELGAAGQTPLVTDLSTWEGRDAAVIVLPAPAGGDAVQVWVVGATCGPDGDALLHYQVVQP